MADKARGKYCGCWEKRLYSLRPKKSLRALPGGIAVDNWHDAFPWPDSTATEEELREKLAKAGLKDFEIELVMEKVVGGRPWGELTKEQGWTSEGSARHFMREALKYLRKAGFRP